MFDPVSLITGGIGLIGSLFGGGSETTTKEESESTSTSSIDYKAMVDAATAAGFNPLTAIRTGGASGFVTTNTKSKGTSTSNSSSGPDFGGIASSVGNIAGALMGGMNNAADPIGRKGSKNIKPVSVALADSSVRKALKRPAGSIYSPATSIGVKVSSNAPSTSRFKSAYPMSVRSKDGNGPGEGTLVGGDNPKVSGMGWNNGRYGLFHAPVFPDADTAENIYGDNELFSMAYTGLKMTADGLYSAYRNGSQFYSDMMPRNVRPDTKYRKQYFDNIRSAVPSLIQRR